MKIKNISIQFNVEIELDNEHKAVGYRDKYGNWLFNGASTSDEQAAELERQFRAIMPFAIRVKPKV